MPSASKKKASVFVVENEETFRFFLEKKIADHPAVKSVLSWAGGEEFLQDFTPPCPDILFIDIRLKEMNGIDLARMVAQKAENCRIVMLTALSGTDFIFQSLKNGAIGYILKNDIDNLHHYIDIFLNDGAILTPEIALKIHRSFHKRNPESKIVLTVREQQIIELISQGLKTKEVARLLTLKEDSVRQYIKRVYQKLQVNSRVELIRKAEEQGLL